MISKGKQEHFVLGYLALHEVGSVPDVSAVSVHALALSHTLTILSVTRLLKFIQLGPVNIALTIDFNCQLLNMPCDNAICLHLDVVCLGAEPCQLVFESNQNLLKIIDVILVP